jgi:two-component system, OmpR family, sensor histidine kinase VicK
LGRYCTHGSSLKKSSRQDIDPVRTKILADLDEIVKQSIHLAESSTTLSIVSVSGGMQLAFDKFLDLYKKFLVIYSKGKKGNGIRCVTNIEDKESIELVKTFINLGTQIRHVKKLASMNFVVGDKEVIATIEKMEGGKMVQSLLTSNEPMYIKHFYSIFEELWNEGRC